VVANAAEDGRTSYSLGNAMLTGLLLGLPLVQPCWLAESVAAGQLMPIENRHLIKVGALRCLIAVCCGLVLLLR
jgi:hypothetical protein